MSTTSKGNIGSVSNETYGLIPADDVFQGNNCKWCGSESLVKWGKQNGQQKYRCKSCGKYQFLNGKFPSMQTDHKVVSAALEWYFSGFSLKKVVWQVKRIFGVKVVRSSVLYWIEKFVPLIRKFVGRFIARGSGLWHVDETVVKAGGEIKWYWEVIDRATRFILGTIYTDSRRVKDARKLFTKAKESFGDVPDLIVCDKLPAYERAVHAVFGYRGRGHRIGFQAGKGPGTSPSNARIERFHNTLKERTKIMRGLQNRETGKAILDGFVLFYNWLRPHESLGERTPAQASGITLDLDRGFADLISYAIQKVPKSLKGA